MEILEILGGVQAILMAVVLAFLARTWRKLDTLDTEITRLRDEKIKGIEDKVEKHITNDKSPQVLAELKQLRADALRREEANDKNSKRYDSMLQRICDKMDGTREDTATNKADIKNNKHYIGNVDKSLQTCKQNHARS